jgi:hypothetical protein
MRIPLLVAMLLGASPMLAQGLPAAQMPPSEELKSSTAPFIAARAQPDDMTQADLLALGVGVSRAAQACLRLEPAQEEWAKNPDELLALARLCLFGRQYEPARKADLRYLALPAPPEREKAILLLTQVFLRLNDPVNAAAQIFTLELVYPYDAQIHYATDQVIDAGALYNEANCSVIELCDDQLKNTLPLLENGKGLLGKESSATPGMLFADAVRCLAIARNLHEGSAQTTATRLERIVQLPAWQKTAELAAMQSALARSEMTGKPTPIETISGKLVNSAGPLRPAGIVLARGTALLVPFALWTPGVLSIVQDFHRTAPRQKIYLLTSWTANTGLADEASKELLDSLRSTAKTLPAKISILVVPDTVLQQFYADGFPAAIIVRDGIVQANLPLDGDAAKRLSLFALDPISPEPGCRHHPHQ